MSDHREPACFYCGSYLHAGLDCPTWLAREEKKQQPEMCGGPPSRRGSPNMPEEWEGVKGGQKGPTFAVGRGGQNVWFSRNPDGTLQARWIKS